MHCKWRFGIQRGTFDDMRHGCIGQSGHKAGDALRAVLDNIVPRETAIAFVCAQPSDRENFTEAGVPFSALRPENNRRPVHRMQFATNNEWE